MLRNVIVMFLIAIALFTTYFNMGVYDRVPVIVATIPVVFFILVYLMAKVRALEMMTTQYNLEHKKRLELEQELLKEIDLSNAMIISRNKTSPTGNAFGQPSTKCTMG